ncbi:MAG TPA: stage III sporulation protein AD [Clostridiales bacterium]|nr:stage III sporulation protein AD [Clostridiales bacterium]
MNIIGLCALAITGALLALWLKNTTPSLSLLVTLAAGVVIFGVILSFIPSAVTKIQELITATGLSSQYGGILFKTLGICFLCQFSSDACRDAGQNALASKVELAGKLMIVILALPMVESITSTATTLIGG